MSEDLRRLAERASSDPWFLGWALVAYQRRYVLDDAALARELSACDTAVVVALRLCRRPGTSQPYRSLEEDVEEIARRFAGDTAALAKIVGERGAAE